MADIVAIATVTGIAAAGEKLSISLINFTSTVGSAAKDIQSIGKAISNVCLVLKRIESIIRKAHRTVRYSNTALADVHQITTGCQAIFDEMQEILESLKKGKADLDIRGRFKWTLKRPKVQILQNELEAAKNTLNLMLTALLISHSVFSSSSTMLETQDEAESHRISTQNLAVAQQHALEELVFLENSGALGHAGIEVLQAIEHVEGLSTTSPKINLPDQNPKIMVDSDSCLKSLLPGDIHKRMPPVSLEKIIQGDSPEMPRLRRVNTFSNLYMHAQDSHPIRNFGENLGHLNNLIPNGVTDCANGYFCDGHSSGEQHMNSFDTVTLPYTSNDMAEHSHLRTFIADRNLNPAPFERAVDHRQQSNSFLSHISNKKQNHIVSRDRSEFGTEILITYQKPLRVLTEDSCSTILQMALKEDDITDDWLQYRLHLNYQGDERLFGLQERPLQVFKQMENEGKQPTLVLRKTNDRSN